MEASNIQILILILTTLGILGFSISAYLISVKKDKIWFYAYTMMLIVLVQWMSDIGASLIYNTYYLHLSSVILFPSIIFCLFISYALQGISSVKKMFYVLIIGELGYFISIGLLSILNNVPSYVQLGLPWISNHLFSTLAIIIDYGILITIWPIIHNPAYKLPLFFKVFFISWILLTIDSLVFTTGTFWNNPALIQIIQANIIVRTALSLLMSPLITIYMSLTIKNSKNGMLYRTWDELLKDPEAELILLESKQKVEKLESLESELEQNNIDLQQQRRAIMNVLEDVQKEKDIVQSQAEELRRFKVAAEQSNEMIVFTDSDGIVLWGNKATEVITGFSLEESVGRKVGLLWGKLMPKEWYQDLWKTVKSDKQIFVSEIQNHRKNGERFWSSFIIYPLLDSNNNVQFFVATQRDITKEKAVDMMKTDFISLASHQLRTPLSAMKWFLEMLLNGDLGKLTKEQKDAINNIDQSNERMIDLVNALLNISRIESGRIIIEPALTDIVKLTSDIVDENRLKFTSKEQNLITSAVKGIPSMMIDPRMIRQVIVNLLTNANKYTPNKGEIKINIAKDDKYVIIEISDNGYGIPSSEQNRLFERFFRASNISKFETSGTGLGLYLAKAIVESSGGKIWFKSREGKGTSFFFSMPLSGIKPKSGEVRLS